MEWFSFVGIGALLAGAIGFIFKLISNKDIEKKTKKKLKKIEDKNFKEAEVKHKKIVDQGQDAVEKDNLRMLNDEDD